MFKEKDGHKGRHSCIRARIVLKNRYLNAIAAAGLKEEEDVGHDLIH